MDRCAGAGTGSAGSSGRVAGVAGGEVFDLLPAAWQWGDGGGRDFGRAGSATVGVGGRGVGGVGCVTSVIEKGVWAPFGVSGGGRRDTSLTVGAMERVVSGESAIGLAG